MNSSIEIVVCGEILELVCVVVVVVVRWKMLMPP